MTLLAEYIWVDGTAPTKQLRSKTRVVTHLTPSFDGPLPPANEFPEWGADGSSTSQAEGSDSDIGLVPVTVVRDPFRAGHVLVLCEVYDAVGEVHASNTRAQLREVLSKGGAELDAWFGFEQEYTFMKAEGGPLGFPDNGYPAPQGPYYCSVGTSNIFGREVYEDFMMLVLEAGLTVSGFNWEVMPGQAEFQVGTASALEATDHVWLARYILHRIAEDYGVVISLDAKPAEGDWNGAGMHTNFSTKEMREPGGIKAIEAACVAIGERIGPHLEVYGHDYQARLTGAHETASFRDFSWGVSDRTASIRIPRAVATAGTGYLEDRRPNANADPYEVAARMIATVGGLD